jgi:hypothetical protein
MSELYDRSWNVTVGDVLVSFRERGKQPEGLACSWTATKTLKREPNTCDLKIWNLSPDTRRRLTAPKKTIVRIEAGYGDKLSQVYLGEVRALMPGEIQGPDIVTELSSGDGEKAMMGAHLAIPVGAKVSNGDALKAIAKALGVGLGNVSKVSATLALSGRAVFPRGTVLVGNVARQLDDFCRSAGLEWSIQDGALQVLDSGASLDKFPYILKADSGLVGSPKMGSDGKVTADTLMLPELRPGLRVEFDTLEVKGLYRLIETSCTGETHGNSWGYSITCEKSKVVI